MAVVSSTLSARRPSVSARKPKRSRIGRRAPYRPYHIHGEAVLLLCLIVIGVLWLMAPLTIVVKLLGLIALWLVLPSTLINQYWPRHGMHDLGWQLPVHPRKPRVYSFIAILISFWPLLLWLLVSQPARYVAVAADSTLITWLFGEVVMIVLLTILAAFLTGVLLFRLSHLIRPWMAILSVGLILGVISLLIPGPVRYFGLPLTLAATWMAWHTRSFVPAAVVMIGITLVYDLIVRLS